jgi:hypothetical protein
MMLETNCPQHLTNSWTSSVYKNHHIRASFKGQLQSEIQQILQIKQVLPSFQIVGCYGFSRYICFVRATPTALSHGFASLKYEEKMKNANPTVSQNQRLVIPLAKTRPPLLKDGRRLPLSIPPVARNPRHPASPSRAAIHFPTRSHPRLCPLTAAAPGAFIIAARRQEAEPSQSIDFTLGAFTVTARWQDAEPPQSINFTPGAFAVAVRRQDAVPSPCIGHHSPPFASGRVEALGDLGQSQDR